MDRRELKKYYEAFTDAWQFLKARVDTVENTDGWWNETISAANTVGTKYKSTEQEYIAKKLMVAALMELQRIAKRNSAK